VSQATLNISIIHIEEVKGYQRSEKSRNHDYFSIAHGGGKVEIS